MPPLRYITSSKSGIGSYSSQTSCTSYHKIGPLSPSSRSQSPVKQQGPGQPAFGSKLAAPETTQPGYSHKLGLWKVPGSGKV